MVAARTWFWENGLESIHMGVAAFAETLAASFGGGGEFSVRENEFSRDKSGLDAAAELLAVPGAVAGF